MVQEVSNIRIKNKINELAKNYPKHSQYDTTKLYELIGGPLNDWFVESLLKGSDVLLNTCATRISYALNYSGMEIPAKPGNGIETFKGGDGLNYIINATHMSNYLKEAFGESTFYNGSTHKPRNGILAMYASNDKNARVLHVDLVVKGKWIGLQDMSPNFFKIWF